MVNINSVISYRTVGNIIETIYKVGNCSFTRTCRTDKRNLFAVVGIQCYIMQYDFFGIISEINIKEFNFTRKTCVFNTAVLLNFFPSPHICLFFRFNNIVVSVVLNIDKCNIAVVLFYFLIHKIEYSFRSGKCHND